MIVIVSDIPAITANFQQRFLSQKVSLFLQFYKNIYNYLQNIFCVIPSDDAPGMALIFQNEATCQTIYENIQKRKVIYQFCIQTLIKSFI